VLLFLLVLLKVLKQLLGSVSFTRPNLMLLYIGIS
jgi:hypothetical protein